MTVKCNSRSQTVGEIMNLRYHVVLNLCCRFDLVNDLVFSASIKPVGAN